MATGDYKQALDKYQQLLKEDPQITDVALFQMGLIYAHPKNPDKDYKISLQYFKRVKKEFPESNLKNQAQTYASLLNKIMQLSIKNDNQHAEIISLKEKCTILKNDNQEKDKKSDELQQQIEKLKEIDLNIQKKKRPVNHK
ncbi:MAG: tetratricopeptide repeat protein [Pseudomonadota bacterium]